MRIVFKSEEFMGLLDHFKLTPLAIKYLSPQQLLSLFTDLTDEVLETIDQTDKVITELQKDMEGITNEYKDILVNNELYWRHKYNKNGLFELYLLDPKKYKKAEKNILAYQNELVKMGTALAERLEPYFEELQDNLYLKEQAVVVKDSLRTYTGFFSILTKLEEYEGFGILLDHFMFVVSTSGIHLIYDEQGIPLGQENEDEFRLYLKDTITEKMVMASLPVELIEVYSITQYLHLDYDELPDRLESYQLDIIKDYVITVLGEEFSVE